MKPYASSLPVPLLSLVVACVDPPRPGTETEGTTPSTGDATTGAGPSAGTLDGADTTLDASVSASGSTAPVDPCQEDPCVNGTCVASRGTAACMCADGWEGETCAVCSNGYRGPGECDPFSRECPEGFKCMPFSIKAGMPEATRCAPLVENPAGIGEVCQVFGGPYSGDDTCGVGAMCVDVDFETLLGTCIELCRCGLDGGDCDGGYACMPLGIASTCTALCNPFEDDCRAGDACYPVDEGLICAPDISGDQGQAGDPCDFINACDPGLYCALSELVPDCAGAGGCCTSFCDLTQGSAVCLPGQSCVPFFEGGAPDPYLDDVGACRLP